MSFENELTGDYKPSDLTKELRYEWVTPEAPKPLDGEPYWLVQETDPVLALTENLAEYEWKVAFIRQQISQLGISPSGRARVDLLRQLVEALLDPQRLTTQYNHLSDQEKRFYKYLVFYTNLESLRTTPTPLEDSFAKTRSTLTKRIIEAGLGLYYEHGEFSIPSAALRWLPPLYIDFPTEAAPDEFIQAPDPQILTSQIQQWLSLVQGKTYHLRKRPKWVPPNVGYMGNFQTWPPTPSYVRKIISNRNFQGAIDLCPPEPYPDAQTLAEWSTKLGLSPDIVEFIYHVMINSRVVRPGDPVTLDQKLAQQWMLHAPGRQTVIIYELFRGIGLWAAWWPLWRRGEMNVRWNYQNYWGITSLDRTLNVTHYMLRWVLLDVLAQLPHKAWLSLEKIAELLATLFPNPNSHGYQRGLLFKGDQQNWKSFLRLALKSLISGPLYYLGFVDIAPTLDAPTYIRLHNLQDVHWGRVEALFTADPQPLNTETVRYIPEKEQLEIAPPAPADFLLYIQRWAKPAGLVNNKLLYVLNLDRLHQTFEDGETPETLAQTWEKVAHFPPLDNIHTWWQYWWQRYGRIRLYTNQAILTTQDDFTMQELQVALPTMQASILGLITPRTAFLDQEHVDEVLDGLERQGYMPKEAL